MRLCVSLSRRRRGPAGLRDSVVTLPKLQFPRYRMYLTIFSAQWHQFTFAGQNVYTFIFSGRYSLRSFNRSLPIVAQILLHH